LPDIYDRQLERDTASGPGQSDKSSLVTNWKHTRSRHARTHGRTQSQSLFTCYDNASGLGPTNPN